MTDLLNPPAIRRQFAALPRFSVTTDKAAIAPAESDGGPVVMAWCMDAKDAERIANALNLLEKL